MSENQTDIIASTHLGKKVDISQEYNPSLLVVVPRSENRAKYGIFAKDLPFEGYDVWYCYEFSSMTLNGLPVTKVIKLKYSSNSEFIIESKSLKLYLNSFNMTRYGKTRTECLSICKNIIKSDLSSKLGTNVEVSFIESFTHKELFSQYNDIFDYSDEKSLTITDFNENPKLLKITEQKTVNEYFLKFDSLRSNCRVTHQPDFGDVFIYYKSKKQVDIASLIKYLVSFRNEYHFHEECCEMIYKRLFDILDTDAPLMVTALYTRRGGIDITPVRYSKGLKSKDIDNLLDINVFARNGIKQ